MKRQALGVLCPGEGEDCHRELEVFAHLPCSMTGITRSSNVDRDHHDRRIEAMVTLDDLRTAQILLDGIAVRTPLFEWTSAADQRKLFLKLENLQPIGAFKLRGAYNKVASLTDEDRHRGVVSYSSGNHGQGVAYAARALGVKAIIVMPSNAPRNKLEATAALGAEIVAVGPRSE